ncbi:MAG TPA: ATP-binding protein [Chthoniobacterales bacterium]|nr:ATP-binding protein [Chthoniobacterales bacterium]
MLVEKSPGALPATVPPASVGNQTAAFAHNALFANLSPDVFETISKRIEILTLAPDQILFQENESGECLYLIAEGSIKISKRGRGGQQETLTYLPANDYFGEMALVDSGKRSAQATAVGTTTLGQVDRPTWDLLLHLAPQQILTNFTRSVTQRLRQNNQLFIDQMMRSERLSLIGTTISSIVHDMNNPIGTILCACGIIQMNTVDEETRQMATHIRDAIERMAAMTRELVDYSRGETELKLELVNVENFVRQLEPDFSKCRAGCDVEISVDFAGSLRIDRHRMLRVFGNLIKNAREAMKAGQENCLRFSVCKIESEAQFDVSDTGHGIRSELLPKIFEPFVTDGKAGGTGLGLAIAKTVVDAHGGTITVESSPAGTTFRITLPIPSEGEVS